MSRSVDNTGDKSRKRWFNNPLLSDVTIMFGSRSIPAHKVILAQGSEYFRKMFTSGFQETEAKVVELFDDDEFAVETVLKSIYGFLFPWVPDDGDAQGLDATWEQKAHVWTAADKYRVPKLKSEMGEQLNKLSDLVSPEVDDLASAARIIWTSASTEDTPIRQMIVNWCIEWLQDRSLVNDDEAFAEMLRENDLMFDVNKELVQRLQDLRASRR